MLAVALDAGTEVDVREDRHAGLVQQTFAQLLAVRNDDGRWVKLYSPKWTSTFYSLRLLYGFGLDGSHPAAVESCALLLDEGVMPDGGIRLWQVEVTDVCVTAMLLAIFSDIWRMLPKNG